MNISRQVAPAALAAALSAALATGLAACDALPTSSSSGSAAGSSAGASSAAVAGNGASSQSASASTDPLASLTATQIFDKALANTSAASSVHLVGSGKDSGSTITFTLDISKGTGCSGAIAEGSKGSFQLIVLGKTVWVKPDTAFWKSAAGSGASATVLSLLEGKYLKGTTGTTTGLSTLSHICALSDLISQQPLKAATLTKTGTSTFGGSQVIVLTDSTTNGVADVTDQAQPLVARIIGKGSDSRRGHPRA